MLNARLEPYRDYLSPHRASVSRHLFPFSGYDIELLCTMLSLYHKSCDCMCVYLLLDFLLLSIHWVVYYMLTPHSLSYCSLLSHIFDNVSLPYLQVVQICKSYKFVSLSSFFIFKIFIIILIPSELHILYKFRFTLSFEQKSYWHFHYISLQILLLLS